MVCGLASPPLEQKFVCQFVGIGLGVVVFAADVVVVASVEVAVGVVVAPAPPFAAARACGRTA